VLPTRLQDVPDRIGGEPMSRIGGEKIGDPDVDLVGAT